MLVKTEDRTLTTIGAQETAQFTIAPNGKAFRVLIDSIYSNKVRAIVRELCTNAYDSHVEAGIPDRAFDLGLPTLIEPSFRVRDYGVSMTHEDIMGLYSTVFESTKDKDNVAVGKFGLGSKTPFAYIDTFTVTAWKDGEKRVYVANLRPDGVPQISLLATEKTTEPTGLEVSFPVESKDFNTFHDEAEHVIPGFDVRPNDIHSSRAWSMEVEEPVMTGSRWKLMKSNGYSHGYSHDQFRVRMGCVLYPLDVNELAMDYDDPARALGHAHIILDVPIGEIEVTAARDAISYTEETRQNLSARLCQISREITSRLQTEISACSSLAEATLRYTALSISLGISTGHASRKLFSELRYRGRKLGMKIGVEREHEKYVRKHLCMMSAHDVKYGLSVRSRQWSGKWEQRLASYPPGAARFYIQDTLDRITYPGERIREDFKEACSKDGAPQVMVWIKCNPRSRDFKRVLVALGRPDPSTFINVVDLPPPPRAARSSRTASKVMCKELFNFKRVDIEVDTDADDIVYIELHRHDFVDLNHRWSNTELAGIWAAMKKAGEVPATAKLVFVPKTHANKIKKAVRWRKFDTVAKIYVHKALANKGRIYCAQFNILAMHASADISLRCPWSVLKSFAENGDLPKARGMLRETISKLRVLIRNRTRYAPNQDVERYYRYLYGADPVKPVAGDIDPNPEVVTDVLADMALKYPLIGQCISAYSPNVDQKLSKNLLRYIDAMDSLD